MTHVQTLDQDALIDVEAEILRYLWYEGKATPTALFEALGPERDLPLPLLHEGIEDLAARGLIFEFIMAPQAGEESIYCLTRRAHRRIQEALRGYHRYRLRAFWDALRYEQKLLHTVFQLDS